MNYSMMKNFFGSLLFGMHQRQVCFRTRNNNHIHIFVLDETINQGTPLSMLTTPDALNTAIYEVTIWKKETDLFSSINRKPRRMIRTISAVYLKNIVSQLKSCFFLFFDEMKFISSDYISQTTHQALQTISDLVDIVSRDNNVGIPTPTVQSMMLSKETMTQTPIKMVSTGTMPQTPVRLLSTGTTPRTPLIVSRATLSGTPTSVSVEVTVRLGASSSDVSTNTDPAPSSSFNRHEQ